MRPARIIYLAGPGDVIHSYNYWKRSERDPSEVSITFSSQVQDYANEVVARTYIVSYHARKEIVEDGLFTLEHRPKRSAGLTGVRYHLAELTYGVGLLSTALRLRADLAIIDSGHIPYYVAILFRLAGIRVIAVLQNTVWPSGFPPRKVVPRLLLWLDSLFFRWAPIATLCISPECERQVVRLTRGRHRPILHYRPQFDRDFFREIPPPEVRGPFRIMFIGRVERYKGVFDILQMAKKIEAAAPGCVRWEICGRGPDLDELKRRHEEMGLRDVVTVRSWVSLSELREVYARSHASIVPTRSGFCEGMAMTALEAILAGRPLITSPVVPALEVVRAASVEARTNDVDSYVEGIVSLISDQPQYERLRDACADLESPYYDRSQGLTAVLRRVIGGLAIPRHDTSPNPLRASTPVLCRIESGIADDSRM
jgi:glycogen synthase